MPDIFVLPVERLAEKVSSIFLCHLSKDVTQFSGKLTAFEEKLVLLEFFTVTKSCFYLLL